MEHSREIVLPQPISPPKGKSLCADQRLHNQILGEFLVSLFSSLSPSLPYLSPPPSRISLPPPPYNIQGRRDTEGDTEGGEIREGGGERYDLPILTDCAIW